MRTKIIRRKRSECCSVLDPQSEMAKSWTHDLKLLLKRTKFVFQSHYQFQVIQTVQSEVC